MAASMHATRMIFRAQAIYFPTSNEPQRTTVPQNFIAVAVLQELLALACIHIATLGRTVQRLADIHSDLHKKH
jgi:hypothetical protein